MLTDARAALKQILIDTGDYADADVHTGRYTRITSLPAAAIIETELETVPITTGRPRTVEYTATATIETYAAETTDTLHRDSPRQSRRALPRRSRERRHDRHRRNPRGQHHAPLPRAGSRGRIPHRRGDHHRRDLLDRQRGHLRPPGPKNATFLKKVAFCLDTPSWGRLNGWHNEKLTNVEKTMPLEPMADRLPSLWHIYISKRYGSIRIGCITPRSRPRTKRNIASQNPRHGSNQKLTTHKSPQNTS